jgi:hypothetical protein
MTSESGGDEERRFLLDPPGPGEISLHIAEGNGVEVTAELQAAFAALVEGLRGGEVQGYVYDAACPEKRVTCLHNGSCGWEQVGACYVDYHCLIGKIA